MVLFRKTTPTDFASERVNLQINQRGIEALPRQRGQKMNNSKSLANYGIKLGIAAFVIALLSNAAQSLAIYVGGNGLTDQPGGVLALSLGSFVIGTLFSTVVHFFIFCVASVIGAVLFGIVRGARSKSDDVGTPAPTGASNAAFASFLKKFVLVVVTIAVLVSGYQALGLYVVLSAVSQAAGLIVLTTVLTFIVGLIYCVAVFGFIGLVATVMLGFLFAFFGGSSKK